MWRSNFSMVKSGRSMPKRTNALRHVPIQYNQSTVLPLPLHLAKGPEEYLFEG